MPPKQHHSFFRNLPPLIETSVKEYRRNTSVQFVNIVSSRNTPWIPVKQKVVVTERNNFANPLREASRSGYENALWIETMASNSEAREWRHDSDKTQTNKLEWWMILKISWRAKSAVPKTLVKRKLRQHSLFFPQNTLMLTEPCGEFSELHSILDFLRFAISQHLWDCFGPFRFKTILCSVKAQLC